MFCTRVIFSYCTPVIATLLFSPTSQYEISKFRHRIPLLFCFDKKIKNFFFVLCISLEKFKRCLKSTKNNLNLQTLTKSRISDHNLDFNLVVSFVKGRLRKWQFRHYKRTYYIVECPTTLTRNKRK